MVDDKKITAKLRLLDLFEKQGKNKTKGDSRLPAGQSLIKEKDHFPVLDLGVQPDMDMKTWKLEITGKDVGIKSPVYFSLDELKKLIGTKNYTKDFHCVTRWSKYDIMWTGIPLKDLIAYLQKNKGLDNSWKHLI